MSKLRDLFNNGEIRKALAESGDSFAKGAKLLSELGRGRVSPQLLRYWVSCMDDTEVDAAATQRVERTRELARARNMSSENNKLRRDMRAVLDENSILSDYALLLGDSLDRLQTVPLPERRSTAGGKKMTVEAIFSDLQIGKLSGNFNTQVAIARVHEYGDALLGKIQQHVLSGYNVELIKLVVLGDVIESDKKHANSGRACDIGTAEQMQLATELLVELVGKLAMTGIKVQCIMVTGNHDHDGHGLNMFMPGQEHLSWPMYNAVKLVCEAKYGEATTFVIPRGAYCIDEIYGSKVLYEHGVGVAASQAGMEKRRDQRAQQQGVHITYMRQGDKHNICRFNNDRLVTNGAFFGSDKVGGEYSTICGYHNEPAQIVFCHVPREVDDPRSSIYDTFVIQLAHIK